MSDGNIRVGIGGWSYAPWRGLFYPPGLPQAREFDHAVNHVTTIEINATFYGRQKPASWAKWAAGAPDGFRFAVKGSRYCVTRPRLADAGDGIARFFEQGMAELGDKLGPILWQFAPSRHFDAADIAAFLALLPETLGSPTVKSLALRHVIEPRHASFDDPAFVALCRQHNAAIAFADDDVHPCIDAPTADFAYARLQRQREEVDTGYKADELDGWAKAARGWAAGGRDVYVLMINGAKVRAPAAAQALIERLSR